MADFRCTECEEEFELKTNCIQHHLETSHENFELIGADVRLNIKSLKN